MGIEISINRATCIKCGKCSRVCPSYIFTQPSANAEIELNNVASCIKCGHCMGACPTGSVKHSKFPPERVHPIDRSLLPSPEEVMLLIKSRRSNRAFSKKGVPTEFLDKILEAANRAPTASNSQNRSYIVITDPEKLHRISELVINALLSKFKTVNNKMGRPIVKKLLPDIYRYMTLIDRAKANFDSGLIDPILRYATAAIFIQTPKKSRYGCPDANLAFQNGSLMAESLGVSQFYTGFVCAVINDSKELRHLLGITGKINAGMGLGMPEFKFVNYIDKNDIKVRRA